MPTLFLNVDDKLLQRSLQELFDPLAEFQWAPMDEADLILTDKPIDKKQNFLLLDQYPLVAEKLIKDIRMILEDVTLEFGPHKLDVRSKILHSPQGKENLTMKEVQVLYYMLKNQGQELSKDEILQEVWGYQTDLDTHTLETHIYRLRQKLEKDPANPQFLKSCGEGYILVEPSP